jgi:hypothetical protein
MESEGSLPCSQEHSTGPYTEPDQSSPYHPIRGMRIMNYAEVFFFVHKRIISAVKRVEFVSDRMSYII